MTSALPCIALASAALTLAAHRSDSARLWRDAVGRFERHLKAGVRA